jgi:hypothetical protein
LRFSAAQPNRDATGKEFVPPSPNLANFKLIVNRKNIAQARIVHIFRICISSAAPGLINLFSMPW